MYATLLDQFQTLCCPLVQGDDDAERRALARELVHLNQASSRRQEELVAQEEGARLEAKLAQVYQECEQLRSRLAVYENGGGSAPSQGMAPALSTPTQRSSQASGLSGPRHERLSSLAPVREEESANERDSDEEKSPLDLSKVPSGPRLTQRRASHQSWGSSSAVEEDGTQSTTSLLAAVREGDLMSVVRLLRSKPGDVNVADGEGVTPLMSACAKGNEQLVDVLLSSGADPNLADMDGVVPLQAAAYDGYGGIVQRLLQARAMVDLADKDGCSALYTVAGSSTSIEHESLVVQLLNAKADPVLAAADGTTPLQVAEETGNHGLVDLLRQAEGQRRKKRSESKMTTDSQHTESLYFFTPPVPNGEDGGGTTDEPGALLLAAQDGTLDEVRRLCAQGALARAGTDIHGQSALHLAAARGRVEIVEALLTGGAVMDTPDLSKTTPLHVAAHEGHQQVVTVLCRAGASVHRGDSQSMSPLHTACMAGHRGVVEALMNAGAKLQDENKAGRSPLHLAASKNHLLVVQCLLELRADANSQDLAGLTPLELCQSDNRTLEDLLLKQMDKPDSEACGDSDSVIV